MKFELRDRSRGLTGECNVCWTFFLNTRVVGKPLNSWLERVYVRKLKYICHNNTLIKPAPSLSHT